MNARDAAAASALLDMDALLDRTTAGITTSGDFQNGFRQGAAKGGPELMSRLADAMGDNGSYHLLRVRLLNGETRALFRLLINDGGLNYHDWVLGTDRQGRERLDDLYVGASGEFVSQTMRRIYVAAAAQADPTWLDRLTGADKTYAANLATIVQFTQDTRNGKFEDALREYKRLPRTMRDDKTFMMMRFAVAQKLQDGQPAEYDAAIADFQRLFPGDPCLDFLCLDTLFAAGKYREALRSVDRIEAFAGSDAYLPFLRANICMMEGGSENLARAKKLYRKSIDLEPTLPSPYWGLVTLSLKTRQFDETSASLDEIERKLPLTIKDLEQIPEYAEFVKSDAYKKWKASRQNAAEDAS